MVLPAMVYKSDPRETMTHFRAVAAADRPADHGLQQPGRLPGGHHARDVRRAGRRAEVCRSRNRPTTSGGSPTSTTLATATCCSAASTTWCSKVCCSVRSAGSRAWSTRSRARTGCSGTWPRPGRWDEALEVYRWYTPLLHLDTHVKLVQYIKLACRNAATAPSSPSAALAARRRGTRSGSSPSSAAAIATRPTVRSSSSHAAVTIATHFRHRLAHRRRADPRGDRGRARPGPRAAGRAADLFREKFDTFRSAVVNEPRGSDVMVGALLCEPHDPACAAGVIFFNNVGTLGCAATARSAWPSRWLTWAGSNAASTGSRRRSAW